MVVAVRALRDLRGAHAVPWTWREALWSSKRLRLQLTRKTFAWVAGGELVVISYVAPAIGLLALAVMLAAPFLLLADWARRTRELAAADPIQLREALRQLIARPPKHLLVIPTFLKSELNSACIGPAFLDAAERMIIWNRNVSFYPGLALGAFIAGGLGIGLGTTGDLTVLAVAAAFYWLLFGSIGAHRYGFTAWWLQAVRVVRASPEAWD